MPVATRQLKTVPLVESLFEVRWGRDEGAKLHREYKLALGQLFERVKRRGYEHHAPLVDLPEELFDATPPVRGVIFDRLLPVPAEQGLAYPMIQFGPGIATCNLDRKTYSWELLRAESANLLQHLDAMLEAFAPRIESICLRSIDFFPNIEEHDAAQFIKSKLKLDVRSPISDSPKFEGSFNSPHFDSVWIFGAESTRLRVQASAGESGSVPGVLLDIEARRRGPIDASGGYQDKLDRLHKLTGDAFFELLSEDLHAELRGN